MKDPKIDDSNLAIGDADTITSNIEKILDKYTETSVRDVELDPTLSITEEDLNILSSELSDEDIDNIQQEVGIKPTKWPDEMVALHIYHAVSNHMERGNHGIIAQMGAVNRCINDLLGTSKISIAKIASESVRYSTMIDEWLVKNGYAMGAK